MDSIAKIKPLKTFSDKSKVFLKNNLNYNYSLELLEEINDQDFINDKIATLLASKRVSNDVFLIDEVYWSKNEAEDYLRNKMCWYNISIKVETDTNNESGFKLEFI